MAAVHLTVALNWLSTLYILLIWHHLFSVAQHEKLENITEGDYPANNRTFSERSKTFQVS